MSHNIYCGRRRSEEEQDKGAKSFLRLCQEISELLIVLWQDTTSLTIGEAKDAPKDVHCQARSAAADCRRKGENIS